MRIQGSNEASFLKPEIMDFESKVGQNMIKLLTCGIISDLKGA